MFEIIKQYIPFFGYHTQEPQKVLPVLDHLLEMYPLAGTEVYIAHIIPREQPLFTSEAEKQKLIEQLKRWKTHRIHCSYWAEPTDFLTKTGFPGLIDRFRGEKDVITYYGDLTGEKMFDRWTQEYELAYEMGAEAITFHLIDYFHIDGQWKFTNSRKDILKGMVVMTQRLLDTLEKRNLLEKGPRIELENAGFGLEYGVQTADDYVYLFDQIGDSHGKLRVVWDTNHLLHALGIDLSTNRGRFFLTEEEVTEQMKELENNYGHNPYLLAHKWIESQLLDHRLIKRISAIHLSDNTLKTIEFFRNGQLTGKYLEEMNTITDPIKKEEYGVAIVLKYYDSHEPLGVTIKNFPEILKNLTNVSPALSILHELKNHELDEEALRQQLKVLQIEHT